MVNPFSLLMHWVASSIDLMVMKPKPRDLPVCTVQISDMFYDVTVMLRDLLTRWSYTITTFSISPCLLNSS